MKRSIKRLSIFICISLIFISSMNYIYADYSDWGNAILYDLQEKGIIKGYSDGIIRPDNAVTRAEFISMLFRVVCVFEDIGQATNNVEVYWKHGDDNDYKKRVDSLLYFKDRHFNTNFEDMQNHWAKDSLAWINLYIDNVKPGYFNNIFAGDYFYPDKLITKEEAALLCVPFVAPSVLDIENRLIDIQKPYKFSDEMNLLVENQIIIGNMENKFLPEKNITLMEASSILYNLMNEVGYRHDYFAMRETIGGWFEGPFTMAFAEYDLNDKSAEQLYYVAVSYFYDYSKIAYGLSGNDYKFDGYIIKDQRIEILRKLEKEKFWNKTAIYYYMFFDIYFDEFFGKYSEKASEDNLKKKQEYLLMATNYLDYSRHKVEDIMDLYMHLFQETKDTEQQKEYLNYIEKLIPLDKPNPNYQKDPWPESRKTRLYNNAIEYYLKNGDYKKSIEYIQKVTGDVIDERWLNYYTINAECLLKSGTSKNEVQVYVKNIIKLMEKDNSGFIEKNKIRKCIWLLKTISRY